MKQRQISGPMMQALLGGELFPLLQAVQRDDTLDMELRGSAVNIYYRGGSIFKIAMKRNTFELTFDTKYCTAGSAPLEAHPSPTEAAAQLPFYKQAMDWWFHAYPKYEREFQQVIARENNSHGKISCGTDYYIADIEFVEGSSRFDMVGLKWLSNGAVRKNRCKLSLALIEMKYGDGALKGSAGIEKHLEDFRTFLSDKEKVKQFCEDMSVVFAQKCALGLVAGQEDILHEFQINPKNELPEFRISPLNPEVIFIFANHDPESTILPAAIEAVDPDDYPFPIMIAEASNMGYGLYAKHLKQLKNDK